MSSLSRIFSTKYWKINSRGFGLAGAQGPIGPQGIVGGVTGPLLTNRQSGSYTLVSNDLGKIVSGISTATVPSNVFSVGSQVSIASTNSTINIKPGIGVTMLQSGVGIKTSVDIGQKSFASILCVSNNVFVINGYLL